jgi:hypothetical protein
VEKNYLVQLQIDIADALAKGGQSLIENLSLLES